MPKVGMEPIRRAALVEATIDEIASAGTLNVTVSQIARRAGMSSGLAHHYFGGKDQIFLAAMRHILNQFGADVRNNLKAARGPKSRIQAILHASFATPNFRPEVVSAWLNFYVLAQSDPDAAKLLRIYRRRLRSNLLHDLRPLVGPRAEHAAARIAGLIDGLYLHAALDRSGQAGADPETLLRAALDQELAA